VAIIDSSQKTMLPGNSDTHRRLLVSLISTSPGAKREPESVGVDVEPGWRQRKTI